MKKCIWKISMGFLLKMCIFLQFFLPWIKNPLLKTGRKTKPWFPNILFLHYKIIHLLLYLNQHLEPCRSRSEEHNLLTLIDKRKMYLHVLQFVHAFIL